MTSDVRKSRCGFAVIKLKINDDAYLLMRANKRWKDLNFIGGHEQPRDSGRLDRAARRELLEEVPALRAMKGVRLSALTDTVHHGPIPSMSTAGTVKYELAFFLVEFECNPRPLLQSLGSRTLNILIREDEVLEPHTNRITGLVEVLDDALSGGIRAIPYSWPADLGEYFQGDRQMNLPLRWEVPTGKKARRTPSQ